MKNDGGPAFPTEESHGDDYEGMSLRDYFAAKAMPAFASIMNELGAVNSKTFSKEQVAHEAYLMADAMLKERVK